MSFSDFLKGQVFILIQWLYAIWQIARDTTFVNSVYYLCQMVIKGQLKFLFRRNTHIEKDRYGVPYTKMEDGNEKPDVIHITKKFQFGKSWIHSSSWEAFKARYFDDKRNRNINGVILLDFNWFWYTVQFNERFYFCHQDILFEWAMYDLHDGMILLKEVELIANELVMGTVISKEEMFETMLSKEYHINELYAPCIFGKQYNISWNVRLSAFLATIPLLLQAKGLSNPSALCTLILIIVDLVRTPLLKLYEHFMSYLTKAVKLWIFRKCKLLYIFFSWFSKRWAACDRRYGYAYYTTTEEEKSVYPVTTFVKFKNLDECQFVAVVRRAKPCIESYGFQINDGIIHSAELSYGEYCLYVKVKEGFFVSSVDALTMFRYNHISKLELDLELLAKILKMGQLIIRGLAKILELQLLRKGSQTLRKILDQKKEDSLLQTAGNINMEEHWNQGGESDVMDEWKKRLQETHALMSVIKDDVPDNVDTFHAIADIFGAYVISYFMATTASDVLVVEVLQGECRAREPLHLVLSFFENADVGTALATLFSMNWYGNKIDGKQKLRIGYLSDVGKDAGGWSAKEFGIMLTTFNDRGGSVGRGGGSAQVAPEAIRCSSSRVTAQRQVIEQSFAEEFLWFRTLRRRPVADHLERGMHPARSESIDEAHFAILMSPETIHGSILQDLSGLNRSMKPTSLYYCFQRQFIAPSRRGVIDHLGLRILRCSCHSETWNASSKT